MITRQKITVTGANGQLGKELQQASDIFPLYDFDFFSKEQLPIDKIEQVRHYFETQRPQYLVNAAAYTAVDKAEEEKQTAFAINATAAGELAKICREYNTRLVHISTDYVFDGNSRVPYKEDDEINPQSVYGASKLKGEQFVFENNADALVIRSSWVYSEFGKNFVKTMIRLMSEKKDISVVNDQYGSPTYAADLAETILEVIYSGSWEPGIYHYSNEGQVSWFDFAVAIKKITGSGCIIHGIPTSEYPTPAKRPLYSVLDTKKIHRVYRTLLKPWKESLKVCLSRLELQADIN